MPEQTLKSALDILARTTTSRLTAERDNVVAKVAQHLGDYRPEVKDDLDALENEGNIFWRRLIADWNDRLLRNLEQSIPRERVLCGFNAFEDMWYDLGAPGEADKFSDWVKEDISSPNADPKAPRKWMLEQIKEAMRVPGREWKEPLHPNLWGQVNDYLESRRLHDVPRPHAVGVRMGGASGNMAHVLSRLGIVTTGHWPYHSKDMAKDSPRGLWRLETGKPLPAKAHGGCPRGLGERVPDPTRRSYIFDFPQGFKLQVGDEPAEARGRVIFLAPRHLGTREWEYLVLRTKTPAGESVDSRVELNDKLGDNGWPFFPAFQSKMIEGDKLVIELAGNDFMRPVAEQFDYFLMAGIQSLVDPDGVHALPTTVKGGAICGEPSVGTIVKHALRQQLEVLASNGVVIHWEIGGVKSPRLFDELAEVTRGLVKSASLNHEELTLLTGEKTYRQTRFAWSTALGRKEPMLERYDRAVHLAGQLGCEVLYVHGNDVDLIVRRHTTRGALRQEIAATLFAKGLVLAALVQRSHPDQFAEHIAPENLQPVLTTKGFIALFELAYGLAAKHFPNNKDLARRTFADIAANGYYFARGEDEYSVMIVPVMWPELNIPFSTAGAGDSSSATVAVYSGR